MNEIIKGISSLHIIIHLKGIRKGKNMGTNMVTERYQTCYTKDNEFIYLGAFLWGLINGP